MSAPRVLLLPFALALLLGAGSAACGGDDIDISKTVKDSTQTSGPTATPTRPSRSTGGTTGGPETITKGLASQYAPALNEIPGVNNVNVPETFTANLGTFASSYLFINNKQGEEKANEWKIVDAYQVAYDPQGLQADLLRGRYYVRAEVYMFLDLAGAQAAYEFMDKFYLARTGTQQVPTKQLANQSNAYKITSGTVGTSDELAAFYRMLVRRGNVVFVIQVNGADKFISVDEARNIAIVVDDRILGNRAAPVPTPIPTPGFGVR